MKTTAEAIDYEFNRKVRSGEIGECLNRWATHESALADVQADRFERLVGEDVDAVLAALVRIVQATKDNTAALVIQKALLPGTLRLASKMLATSRPGGITIDDVIAQVYETLFRIPIQNRRNKVAANILLDSRQRLSRDQRRGELSLLSDELPGINSDYISDLSDSCSSDGFETVEGAMLISRSVSRYGTAANQPINAYIGTQVLLNGQRAKDVASELGCPDRIVHDRLTHIRNAVRHQLTTSHAA